MWRVTILITPKPTYPNPHGKGKLHDLHALGFTEVTEVIVGKMLELQLPDCPREQAHAQAERMCEQLLAHQLLENYEISIEAVP